MFLVKSPQLRASKSWKKPLVSRRSSLGSSTASRSSSTSSESPLRSSINEGEILIIIIIRNKRTFNPTRGTGCSILFLLLAFRHVHAEVVQLQLAAQQCEAS